MTTRPTPPPDLTLYIRDDRFPDKFRFATPEEIGAVARALESALLRSLLGDQCTPIPVKITWAGRNRTETELHSRQHCEHVWERGEPRVHLDTTTDLYIIGQGELERGELET